MAKHAHITPAALARSRDVPAASEAEVKRSPAAAIGEVGRREIFGGVLAGGLGALAASAVGIVRHAVTRPDAEITAHAATFMAAHETLVAGNQKDSGIGDDEFDAATDAWHDALKRITDLAPTTMEGVRLKANVVLAAFQLDAPPPVGVGEGSVMRFHEHAAWRLAQDVLALGAVA